MAAQEDERDPLNWLDENQAILVDSVMQILQCAMTDEDLKERLIGAMLEEIDHWGLEREELKNAPTGGKPN